MAEVDNPKHAYLKGLLTRVQEIQGQLQKKLDKPTSNMESGKVWTSKTATAWKGTLGEKTGAYNGAVNALDDELSAMLERTPAKCSQEEADAWYREQNNYNRTQRF